MCGIIGISGNTPVQEEILNSLKRLEYRGYDSSGIATIHQNKFYNTKSEGKLINLHEKLKLKSVPGNIGIGHTRWATHGNVSEINAHPHLSGGVAIVHNGIIENYLEIKDELIKTDRKFFSDTDSEVIAHLFDKELSTNKDLKQATINVLKMLEGAFAFVLINLENPHTLIAARQSSPLAIGIGNDFCAVGSDAIALSGITDKILFLEDGDFSIIEKNNLSLFNVNGEKVQRELLSNTLDNSQVLKGNYRHYMQKEIFEQPETVGHCLSNIFSDGKINSKYIYSLFSIKPNSITILASGTSNYAAMVGKYWIEEMSRIAVNVEIASEYRYRNPVQDPKGIVIVISQSGESIDTLMAMRHASNSGIKTIAIVNNEGSTIDREANHSIYIKAGPEIAVASTKCFTGQLSVMISISLILTEINNPSYKFLEDLKKDIFKIPGSIAKVLKIQGEVSEIANEIYRKSTCLYLSRGPLFPIALEGALKLKEISYIHAEGFSAGEMKHGPIALIEEDLPVISIIADDIHAKKTISNLREALARGAKIIIFADSSIEIDLSFAYKVIRIPYLNPLLTPIIASIPIQLLAYYVAVSKGTDVDQPKNLAKSVTVE